MPDVTDRGEDEAGPLPDAVFVSAIKELHEAAGSPTLRDIEMMARQRREPLSRTTISNMLRGTINPRWARWSVLVVCLADSAVERTIDPQGEVARLFRIWRGGEAGLELEAANENEDAISQTASGGPYPDAMAAALERAAAEAHLAAEAERAQARQMPVQEDPGHQLPDRSREMAVLSAAEGPAGVPTRGYHVLVIAMCTVYSALIGGLVGCIAGSLAAGARSDGSAVIVACAAGTVIGLFSGASIGGVGGRGVSWMSAIAAEVSGLLGLGGFVGMFVGATTAASHAGWGVGLALGFGIGGAVGGIVGCIATVALLLRTPNYAATPADRPRHEMRTRLQALEPDHEEQVRP